MRTASAGRSTSPSLQRAEVVGDTLGQHRHDAVREIDRIAALERFAVEGGAGTGHTRIRQRWRRRRSPRLDCRARGRVRHRRRLVMVLGVGRIDGDQRHARANPCGGSCPTGLGICRPHAVRCGGEDIGNAVGMDGDHRDRLFGGHRTDDRQHLGAGAGHNGRLRIASTSTRSPSLASPRNSGRRPFRRHGLSIGRDAAHAACPWSRKTPRPAFLRLSMILTTRAV